MGRRVLLVHLPARRAQRGACANISALRPIEMATSEALRMCTIVLSGHLSVKVRLLARKSDGSNFDRARCTVEVWHLTDSRFPALSSRSEGVR